MLKQSFILPKLGNRTYLQGTTIYDALMTNHPHVTDIDFQIKAPIFSNEIIVVSSEEEPSSSPSITLSFTEKGKVHNQHIYPGDFYDPTHTAEFDESVELFDFKQKHEKIIIHTTPYSPIKTLVVFNKLVLKKFLHPDQFFLFARLLLKDNSMPLNTREGCEISFYKKIGDFFYSKIHCGGTEAGMLCFRSYTKQALSTAYETFLKGHERV